MQSIDSFHFHLLLSQDNCLFMSIIYYFSFLSFNKNVEMYSNIGCSILPLCRWHNDLMQQLSNQHAPLKTRSVTEHQSAPWINNSICAVRQELRRAERTAHRTKLTVHREISLKQNRTLRALHWAMKGDCATGYVFCSSSRLLHTDSITDKFTGRMPEPKLPTSITCWVLPNAFCKHLPSAWFTSCSSSIWTFAGMRMCFWGDLYLRTW